MQDLSQTASNFWERQIAFCSLSPPKQTHTCPDVVNTDSSSLRLTLEGFRPSSSWAWVQHGTHELECEFLSHSSEPGRKAASSRRVPVQALLLP